MEALFVLVCVIGFVYFLWTTGRKESMVVDLPLQPPPSPNINGIDVATASPRKLYRQRKRDGQWFAFDECFDDACILAYFYDDVVFALDIDFMDYDDEAWTQEHEALEGDQDAEVFSVPVQEETEDYAGDAETKAYEPTPEPETTAYVAPEPDPEPVQYESSSSDSSYDSGSSDCGSDCSCD